MRYIPVSCLKPGMELAKTVYNKTDAPYLVEGTKLTENYIDSIGKQNISGLYINDEISKDVEVISVISEKLRFETVNVIRQLFILDEKISTEKIIQSKKSEIVAQISSIIDDLLENKDLMVNMIDLKSFDNYTYTHSVNVAILSLVVGIEMGFDRKVLTDLGLGSILHDIGKVFISKEILNKPGKLTDEEYEIIKTHSFKGYELAKNKYRIPMSSYIGILDHHEKWDGTGYPNKSEGKNISLFGRIISVADVFDALTSMRPYSFIRSPSDAMEFIIANSGIMFDTNIVDIFKRKIAPYPVGTTVTLSNGYTAIIVRNHEEFCLRPVVRLIYDPDGNDVDPVDLDLLNDFSLLNIVITGTAT